MLPACKKHTLTNIHYSYNQNNILFCILYAQAYNNKLNIFPYNDTTPYTDGIQKGKMKNIRNYCLLCIKCMYFEMWKIVFEWRVGDIALRIVIEIVCGSMYVYMYKYNVYV